MMCYRCEYRAKFLEAGGGDNAPRPRYECGNITRSVSSCYMFMPCYPLEMKKDPNDSRALHVDWRIAGRPILVGLVSDKISKLKMVKVKKETHTLLWDVKKGSITPA